MNSALGLFFINKYNKKERSIKIGIDYKDINYDLAVVLKHFPQWRKKQEKLKAERIEAERAKREAVRIDYDNMYRREVKPDGIGDLSSILDEFF